jgi:hypothetical protein
MSCEVAENEEARQKIEVLERENNDLKRKIEVLERENNDSKREIEVLERKNEDLKREIEEARQKIKVLEREIEIMKRRCDVTRKVVVYREQEACLATQSALLRSHSTRLELNQARKEIARLQAHIEYLEELLYIKEIKKQYITIANESVCKVQLLGEYFPQLFAEVLCNYENTNCEIFQPEVIRNLMVKITDGILSGSYKMSDGTVLTFKKGG